MITQAVQELTRTDSAMTQALASAAEHADDVDARGRFPREAIEGLRSARALGFHVPVDCGGSGMDLIELGEITGQISRRCASTGMIFAMHQIQVASIARHCGASAWFRNFLCRITAEQRLIASATSEANVGGDLRKSVAALAPCGSQVCFEKHASAISYGAYADDLLTTVRRSPGSDPGDQVLVLSHLAEMRLEQAGDWNAFGMRGTCSPGFMVKATCLPDQVLSTPFSVIAAETMVPVSHILWAHVWLGIAMAAFQKAQSFVRAVARKTPDITPPSALRLAELSTRLAQFRDLVRAATEEFAHMTDRAELSTAGYMVRINNLKLNASEAVVEVCQGALRICGFPGYKNDGPYSVGRHLRDAHSAALMIANDRLLATNASLLLVYREGV